MFLDEFTRIPSYLSCGALYSEIDISSSFYLSSLNAKRVIIREGYLPTHFYFILSGSGRAYVSELWGLCIYRVINAGFPMSISLDTRPGGGGWSFSLANCCIIISQGRWKTLFVSLQYRLKILISICFLYLF